MHERARKLVAGSILLVAGGIMCGSIAQVLIEVNSTAQGLYDTRTPLTTSTMHLYDTRIPLTTSTQRPICTPTPLPTPTPTPTPTPEPTPTPDPVYLANIDLLARLIYCEAGNEGNKAMTAIGQVVYNRMDYFNKSMAEAIYEPGVFTPVATGWIETVEASDDAYLCAQQLIDGATCPEVSNALWFCTEDSYKNTSGFHYMDSHGEHPYMYVVGTIGTTIFFAPM